jgi:hypothetical protein
MLLFCLDLCKKIVTSRCIIVQSCACFTTMSYCTFSCYISWTQPGVRCLYGRFLLCRLFSSWSWLLKEPTEQVSVKNGVFWDAILHSQRRENLKSYRVGVFLPSPEDGNRFSCQAVAFQFLEFRTTDKVQKHCDSEGILLHSEMRGSSLAPFFQKLILYEIISFWPEDGVDTFLWNVGPHITHTTSRSHISHDGILIVCSCVRLCLLLSFGGLWDCASWSTPPPPTDQKLLL